MNTFRRYNFGRVLFTRYSGVKIFALGMLGFSFATAFYAGIRAEAVPEVPDLFSTLWLSYVWEYWRLHLVLFVILFLVSTIIFNFDIFEGLFNDNMPLSPPRPNDDRMERNLRRVGVLLLSFFYLEIVFIVPVLHLAIPKVLRVVAVVMPVLVTLGGYFFAWIPPTGFRTVRRLGSFKFSSTLSFNTASLSIQPNEVRDELKRYEMVRRSNPRSVKALQYLKDGDHEGYWKGYSAFYQLLAQILSISVQCLSTYRTTTEAIRRSLEVAVTRETTVLTTDMEYYSVQGAVADVCRRMGATRVVVEMRSRHFDGLAPPEMIVDTIKLRLKEIRASDPTKRIVVLVSHVVSDSGAVLPVSTLVSLITDDTHLNTILIVDGAQAFGNIEISSGLLQKVHFYATSGHKWLLGTPALGILVHSVEQLQRVGISPSDLIDRGFPYSHAGYDPGADHLGESVTLDPMVSLNAMLSEFQHVRLEAVARHNQHLAQIFTTLVTPLSVRVVGTSTECGIVTLRVPDIRDARKIKALLEHKHQLTCEALDHSLLRFAFHYFMGTYEVHSAVHALHGALSDSQTKREVAVDLGAEIAFMRQAVIEFKGILQSSGPDTALKQENVSPDKIG